ncbi:MAG: metallophosphoesterase [Bacteroides sp.]|nr:metallophosphoesterase [Bacteroides sp.]
MWMFVFFILPFAGLAYALWHVWCMLPLSGAWKWTVIAVCVLCFLTLFLNFSRTIERMPLRMASTFYEIGNSSIFILLYVVMLFLVLDLGRLVHLVPRTMLYNNAYTSIGVLVLLMGLFVYGNLHYHNKVRQTIDLPTAKTLDRNLRVVMMSDLHLGYHNRRAELARWVDLVNAEHPDLILIAGDIVDISIRPLVETGMAEEFKRLKAPIYACLGNHEYYANEPLARKFYDEAGITLLRDSVTTVGNLCLIGRDDRTNQHRKSLGVLMREADNSKYTILLDHQPYHLEQAERAGIDFQFSGHTHHGQVWPISWITQAIYEDAFGPWQRGNTRYYVSSGMGIWGGKFRIGTCSEYIVADIRKE